jgi:C1A family cysteine protease
VTKCHLGRRWSVAPIVAVLALAFGLGLSPVARAAADAQIIPGLRQRIMVLPAALTTRLSTTKQRANLAELQRIYVVRDGVPNLLTRGQLCQLLPVDKLEYTPTQVERDRSQVLVGAITRYRDFLHRPVAGLLPSSVDRRPQQTSIKNQNPRGTCYAFASIAGLEAAYGGGTLDLSENYTNFWFMQHEGKTCQQSSVGAFDWGSVLNAHAVCTETRCPYQIAPFPTLCTGATTPSPARRTDAAANSPYQITNYTPLWRDDTVADSGVYANNPNYLKALLASGKEAVIGLFIAGWTDTNMANVIDVTLDGAGNPLPSNGGHVMLVVGYDNAQDCFIVKNSWGSSSGHAGYVYLSYDYLRTYAQLGYVINEVKPLLITTIRPELMRTLPK